MTVLSAISFTTSIIVLFMAAIIMTLKLFERLYLGFLSPYEGRDIFRSQNEGMSFNLVLTAIYGCLSTAAYTFSLYFVAPLVILMAIISGWGAPVVSYLAGFFILYKIFCLALSVLRFNTNQYNVKVETEDGTVHTGKMHSKFKIFSDEHSDPTGKGRDGTWVEVQLKDGEIVKGRLTDKIKKEPFYKVLILIVVLVAT